MKIYYVIAIAWHLGHSHLGRQSQLFYRTSPAHVIGPLLKRLQSAGCLAPIEGQNYLFVQS